MTDTEKIKRITNLYKDIDLVDITHEKFEKLIYDESINDVISTLWHYYCIVRDVCDTLNM